MRDTGYAIRDTIPKLESQLLCGTSHITFLVFTIHRTFPLFSKSVLVYLHGMTKRSTEKPKTLKPSGKRDENFFELVFDVARQIPRGRVTSYGAIAACLGTRSSARLVGWAMNGAGRVRPKVPAHRVVNRMGILSGKHHFSPPGMMEKLLKKEGIKVKNDQVVDFKKHFWDPIEELNF